jgi:hypothetical protein
MVVSYGNILAWGGDREKPTALVIDDEPGFSLMAHACSKQKASAFGAHGVAA